MLDDSTVALDVTSLQIVEQCAALAYELCKRTGCAEILVVGLQVLGEVLDAEREESNLALCRTGVCC